MKYNFDKSINRYNTNCVKWDEMESDDIIPMWVADMDFETAPCVIDALKARMEHGCFGYTFVPESYYESVISWFSRRHGWSMSRESFIYTSGVVPAISAIIKAMTVPGDKVLIQTPVYNCFFSSIRNNGCELAENELVNTDNRYTIDFEDFEKKCADEKVKVFILCNPHNPAGRVWTKEELQRMGDICKKHGVFVIADEIHCEFTNHCQYVPFATASDATCAVCISPSKAFNIAGLQIANIITEDEEIRSKVDKAININEVCDVNPFGVIALQAAYNEGEEWLDQLNEYIYANYNASRTYIEEHCPQLKVTTLEGTYLMWVNIRGTGLTTKEVCDTLLSEGRVYVNAGTMYGEKAGEGYIRVNLATSRDRVMEGIKRICTTINNVRH